MSGNQRAFLPTMLMGVRPVRAKRATDPDPCICITCRRTLSYPPLGERFTWPLPDSGALATNHSFWSSIHLSMSSLGISSYQAPMALESLCEAAATERRADHLTRIHLGPFADQIKTRGKICRCGGVWIPLVLGDSKTHSKMRKAQIHSAMQYFVTLYTSALSATASMGRLVYNITHEDPVRTKSQSIARARLVCALCVYLDWHLAALLTLHSSTLCLTDSVALTTASDTLDASDSACSTKPSGEGVAPTARIAVRVASCRLLLAC